MNHLKEQARLTYKQMYFLMSIFTDFYTKLERKAPRVIAIHELFRLHAALYCFQKLLEEIQAFEANKTYSYHQPVNVVRLFVDKVESIVRDLQSEAIPSESEIILQKQLVLFMKYSSLPALIRKSDFHLSPHME